MLRSRLCTWYCVVLAVLSTVAHAQPNQEVHVTEYRDDGGFCDGGSTVYTLQPGQNATINLAACARRVNIVVYPLEDNAIIDIGKLTFTGGPGAWPVDIVLGFGDINQNDVLVTPIGRDWGGLDTSQLVGEANFAGAINGDLTGPVDVQHMYRFDVVGEVQASVEVDSPFPGGILVLEADAIAPGGWLRVDSGDILRVRTYQGLEGSVIATQGAITEGVFAGTTIGSPGSPVTITAGYGNLVQVKAQAIYANITAVEGPQFSGYLGRLEATSGQFVGSILAHELRNNNEVSQFSCVGDMDADIATAEGINGNPPGNLADPLIITGGDFPEERELSVTSLAAYDGRIEIREVAGTSTGGHLYGDMLFGGGINTSDRDIFIDNGLCGLLRIGYQLAGDIRIYGTPGQTDEGLTGQVIVNGQNWPEDEPHGWDDWTGSVTIGPDDDPNEIYPITLSPIPYYDNHDDELGGGAVGKVPYYLHYQDCTPSGTKVNENMSTGLDGWTECAGWHVDKVLGTGEILQYVTLHHYGPIEREGTGMPVWVWRKPLSGIGCNWTDVTTSFSAQMHVGSARDIRLSGPFTEGYVYKIEPKDDNEADYLYCGGLDANVGQVPVHDYDFVIRVRRIQDTTLNGLVQPDDITEWLANPIDTTLDGITDSADLVDVTEAVAESEDW